MKPPKWSVWGNIARYTTDEAAAVSLNFCPNAVADIRDQVLWSTPPAAFNEVAAAHGMDLDEAEELEGRTLLLNRQFNSMISKAELIEFAQRVGWYLPAPFSSALESPSESPIKPPLTDKGRTSLLKTIGLLAAQVASMSSNEHKYYHPGRKNEPDSTRINISAIVEELVARAGALPSGDSGLGPTSLENRIKEGLRLLERPYKG